MMLLTSAGTEHMCTYIHGGKTLTYINNFLKIFIFIYLFFMTTKGWGWLSR